MRLLLQLLSKQCQHAKPLRLMIRAAEAKQRRRSACRALQADGWWVCINVAGRHGFHHLRAIVSAGACHHNVILQCASSSSIARRRRLQHSYFVYYMQHENGHMRQLHLKGVRWKRSGLA